MRLSPFRFVVAAFFYLQAKKRVYHTPARAFDLIGGNADSSLNGDTRRRGIFILNQIACVTYRNELHHVSYNQNVTMRSQRR